MYTSYSKVYNCSDGVQIPGTLPKLSRTLKLDAPPHRKPLLLQRLRTELVDKRAGEMITQESLAEIEQVFGRWYDDLLATIAEARAAETSYVDFYEKCMPFLVESGENPYQRALRSVHVGTLMICFQMGYFFYRRVPPEFHVAMMTAFLDAVRERIEAIRQDFELHFGNLQKLAEAA
jgi:hypothetical protein